MCPQISKNKDVCAYYKLIYDVEKIINNLDAQYKGMTYDE